MKLTRLELSGFKSFADTVNLTFENGVTCIVGPNGCGKSNVSDAVRWVLGEQSARLLRGGKMEDVIFQGSAARRPVNVTEVSLYLDNSDGDLPIAYQEVVITRRLSRSGQSDYMLNGSIVRLRDIQDLLRGTGLGSDAGVVIEAKMIDLLLSDRAEERRSLFEEAAGIGLYRDRKQSTERRLDETAQDLQRVEDLIAEVQSQLRSLARQKGKAERHGLLLHEKFSVQITLARRQLDQLAEEAAAMQARHQVLRTALPESREAVHGHERARAAAAEQRAACEAGRTTVVERLAAVRLDLGRLDGELNVALERLGNLESRRERADAEREQQEARAAQSARELEAASAERDSSSTEHGTIESELQARTSSEDLARARLGEARNAVRTAEHELQTLLQSLRSLEGERSALDLELDSLRERQAQAEALRTSLQAELAIAQRTRDHVTERASMQAYDFRRATETATRARHLVSELKEAEAIARGNRWQAEEALTQNTTRRRALAELERERVGLAPAAAALLVVKDRFGDGVLGPLSDFVSTGRESAELAERLLGEWMHAVLVQDEATVDRIRAWHADAEPGGLVLLPIHPGPARGADADVDPRLEVDEPATAWVAAALAGSQALDDAGRVLRRASGAIFLAPPGTTSGPLSRRAELMQLGDEGERYALAVADADNALACAGADLAHAESDLTAALARLEQMREDERAALSERDGAIRLLGNLAREHENAATQLARVLDRLAAAESRRHEIAQAVQDGERRHAELQQRLGTAREELQSAEGEQETQRDARVQWQVREAQVAARHRAAAERVDRAQQARDEATAARERLLAEAQSLGAEAEALAERRVSLEDERASQQATLRELEQAATEAERELGQATAALTACENALDTERVSLEQHGEEFHGLELRLAEVSARKRSIGERVQTEWRKPLEDLLDGAQLLDLDLETLEQESARIVSALETIGPVNALAVEEHADEQKRLEFLITQRDDLVSARQSLLQAIREIDGTARELFLQTFSAVQGHFQHVFATLFGGGECELRLANPDEPLESDIEIQAAPRGKRTQRIHLLSSGERTLVAVSLLFSIYLTKPSPFCLMDEVDAPLDDSNVGRFTRLLDEFKSDTQFIVITHNPRTMQSADAVYGVTMQEPGVSTIVGVRLGDQERVA